MNKSTPTEGCGKMSSGLRDRLKKCGRYHSSPKPADLMTGKMKERESGHQLSTMSPKQLSAEPEQGSTYTPVRKRVSSSPQGSKMLKKRQILKPTGDENILSEDSPSSLPSLRLSSNLTPASKNCETVVVPTSEIRVKCQEDVCHLETEMPSCSVTQKPTSLINNEQNKGRSTRPSQKCTNLESEGSKTGEDINMTTTNEGSQVPQNMTMPNEGKMRAILMEELREKEETLRKLKMVQMYRSKNDLTNLQRIIDKWRGVIQQVLPDLHAEMSTEPKPTLTQLIDHLGIDHTFIQYDPEEETFGS